MNTQTASAPNVSVIPATKRSVQNGGQLKKQKKVRVAAYCRVSTGDESQKSSFTEQNKFYTELIERTDGWVLAGIYADEAITGTSRVRRKDFNRMMEDALAGKIDYIVTKSISRFARNTVDTLSCIRELRNMDPPVGVYFEKEHIDTLDAKGELILKILSALAQDESRSISDNIRWSIQKRFQAGKPHINLERMIGYTKGPNGEWQIVPEQAEIVRFIFEQFLLGQSANAIAKMLNDQGKRSINGKLWTHCTVYHILKNEKFVGDCEMQKTITKDFLTHYSTPNMGEAPRYYVKDHHVGIIDRDTWDRTQAILLERGNRTAQKKGRRDRSLANKSPFGNLFCGTIRDGEICGIPYYRADYQAVAKNYTDERSCGNLEGYRDKYRFAYIIWRCGSKKGKAPDGTDHVLGGRYALNIKDDGRCPSAGVYEIAIEQSFMEMLYALKRDYEANGDASFLMREYTAAYNAAYKRSKSGTFCAERLATLEHQIEELEENLQKITSRQVEAMRDAALEQKEDWRYGQDAAMPPDEENEIEIQKDAGDSASSMDDIYQDASVVSVYADLARDIEKRLEESRAEKAALEAEQGSTATMQKNFDFFLRCLLELPETNPAGKKLNVNGLDTDWTLIRTSDGKPKAYYARSNINTGKTRITPERIEMAPDFLPFSRGIYVAFIEKGVVKENCIEFYTNFGIRLTCRGTGRTLAGFLGYRKFASDGTVEILLENWQVNGKKVNYSRVKAARKKALTETKE